MSYKEPEAKIFACSQSVYLAEEIASRYGVPLGKVTFSKYSDGEFQPSFEETEGDLAERDLEDEMGAYESKSYRHTRLKKFGK